MVSADAISWEAVSVGPSLMTGVIRRGNKPLRVMLTQTRNIAEPSSRSVQGGRQERCLGSQNELSYKEINFGFVTCINWEKNFFLAIQSVTVSPHRNPRRWTESWSITVPNQPWLWIPPMLLALASWILTTMLGPGTGRTGLSGFLVGFVAVG